MGGPGGVFYHRSTTDGAATGARGHTAQAEKMMTQRNVHPSVVPTRRISTRAKAVLSLVYDVSASPDNLPVIFVDKLPMFAGQMAIQRYIADPEVSLAAVGDLLDRAPLQVCDYCGIKDLDDWVTRLWREGDGKGNHVEGYELAAYYYAYMADIPDDAEAFCIFLCDEGIRDSLYKSDLDRNLGGSHKATTTDKVFEDLLAKYHGNVFLLHRQYGSTDRDRIALAGWERRLGKERIVHFGYNDKAIIDILLGVIAIASGTRTLEEFHHDMIHGRDVPQTPERVEVVMRTLKPFWKSWQKQERPIIGAPDEKAQEASIRESGFPTPDDINANLGKGDEELVELCIRELRGLLLSKNRPMPTAEGWTYCQSVKLPPFVTKSSPWEKYLQDLLAQYDWEIEVHTDHLRIRRLNA